MAAQDPQVAFRFEVEFGDWMKDVVAYQVDGMGYSVEVIDNRYTASTMESPVQKLAGRLRWQDLVIRYMATSGTISVWNWRKEVNDNGPEGARVNGSIKALNRAGDVIAQWDVEDAWAAEVSGPDMDTSVSDVMVEQVKIVHGGITRVA